MNRRTRTTTPRTAIALALSAVAAALVLGGAALPTGPAQDTSGRHVVADGAVAGEGTEFPLELAGDKTEDPLEWNSKE
ncbi:hypothetical protein [Streptomyces sp. NPDC001903]|uniref:hypothetical protein n=1 Tax=Streptomyces sp. NPDC001903 TaxID=3364622 RepID=UPI0036A4DB81